MNSWRADLGVGCKAPSVLGGIVHFLTKLVGHRCFTDHPAYDHLREEDFFLEIALGKPYPK